MALGTFIHHFGSRTGTAPAPLPPEVLFPPYTGKKSLCLIVKNEQDNIAEYITPVLDLFDEVIVQNTGSTDRTREIAAGLGPKVKVFEGTWHDSFAEARNRALSRASGDWLMWMDADDRIDADNHAKLAALFAELKNENVAYTMKCVCLPDGAGRGETVVDHVRLFRSHPSIRWEYRVHEQILPSVRRLGGEVRWADVAILHTGYQDAALRGRKLQRDLRLLEQELAERPDEPFCLFNLGCILQDLGQHERALKALKRSLERSHKSDSIVRKLYALIAGCHLARGQNLEALAACKEGLQHCPDDAELLYRLGRVQTDLLVLDSFHAYEPLRRSCAAMLSRPDAPSSCTTPPRSPSRARRRGSAGCGRPWRSSWPKGVSVSSSASPTTTA